MANILEYAEKYATVSTNEMPYNELDGLVLSELAYINWENVVPGLGESSQITLHDAVISLQASLLIGVLKKSRALKTAYAKPTIILKRL